MSVEYCRCRDCERIYRRSDLPVDYRSGITGQAHCPLDLCVRFDDVKERVCTNCEQALSAENDDYCEDCRDGSDEKIFDMEAAAILAKRNPCPRYGSALRNIALGRQLEEA